jgi:putative aminopeptidase FrvX
MAAPISAALEVKPDRLKKILQDLVDIYSPSGKEEEILQLNQEYHRKAA